MTLPPSWWESASTVVTAAATLGLTFFAFVQVWREGKRDDRLQQNRGAELGAVAWLARRSCEAMLWLERRVERDDWVKRVGMAAPLNLLQEHFLRVLQLGTEQGGQEAEHASAAFNAFIMAADRINNLGDPAWCEKAKAPAVEQEEREALEYLQQAVEELSVPVLAPRRRGEPAPPPLPGQ